MSSETVVLVPKNQFITSHHYWVAINCTSCITIYHIPVTGRQFQDRCQEQMVPLRAWIFRTIVRGGTDQTVIDGCVLGIHKHQFRGRQLTNRTQQHVINNYSNYILLLFFFFTLLLLLLLLLLLSMLLLADTRTYGRHICSIGKLSSPYSSIFSFLLQLPVPCSVPQVIKELWSSSSYSFHFHHMAFLRMILFRTVLFSPIRSRIVHQLLSLTILSFPFSSSTTFRSSPNISAPISLVSRSLKLQT